MYWNLETNPEFQDELDWDVASRALQIQSQVKAW